MNVTDRQLAALKAALLLLCLVPLARLAWGAGSGTLGPNPIEAVTRGLGDWALNFLVITLTVTPLRRATGWAWLIRLRRMLGLATFGYAVLHLASYLWFDQFFDWHEILRDIAKRPFITLGFATFLLMLPLALTSNQYSLRRLGGRRWQRLHRAVYAIAIFAVVHHWWMVKIDTAQPAIYAALVAFLLGLRAWWREQERRAQLAGKYAPGRPPRIGGKIIPIIRRH